MRLRVTEELRSAPTGRISSTDHVPRIALRSIRGYYPPLPTGVVNNYQAYRPFSCLIVSRRVMDDYFTFSLPGEICRHGRSSFVPDQATTTKLSKTQAQPKTSPWAV